MISNEGWRRRVSPNFPTRFHPSDVIDFGSEKVVIISKLVSTASIILCTLLSLEITHTSNDIQASFRVKVMNTPQENAAKNEENQSKLFQAV